jgi:hypothetical protein
MMIDLELYAALVDFFDGLEADGSFMGAGEAAFDWFRDHDELNEDELDYVLMGLLRLVGHWKGEDWETRPRRAELDVRVWTFHRVWTDRYGWEPTMRLGKERRERQAIK